MRMQYFNQTYYTRSFFFQNTRYQIHAELPSVDQVDFDGWNPIFFIFKLVHMLLR